MQWNYQRRPVTWQFRKLLNKKYWNMEWGFNEKYLGNANANKKSWRFLSDVSFRNRNNITVHKLLSLLQHCRKVCSTFVDKHKALTPPRNLNKHWCLRKREISSFFSLKVLFMKKKWNSTYYSKACQDGSDQIVRIKDNWYYCFKSKKTENSKVQRYHHMHEKKWNRVCIEI